MKTTATPSIRTLLATAGLGAVLLSATGCSAISLPTGAEYDKAESYDFTDLQDSTARQVLPSWVPEAARNIKEEQRTTGHERLIVMDVAGAEPPAACARLETPGRPTSAETERGLLQEGGTRAEAVDRAASQHTTPLLEADWWPSGQEEQSTHLCGKWWVSVEDGKLYAYSPETQTVADGVKQDRAAEQ